MRRTSGRGTSDHKAATRTASLESGRTDRRIVGRVLEDLGAKHQVPFTLRLPRCGVSNDVDVVARANVEDGASCVRKGCACGTVNASPADVENFDRLLAGEARYVVHNRAMHEHLLPLPA